MKKYTCIVCEKELTEENKIDKHEVNFCSEECVIEYEKKLKELGEVVNWDNCC